MISIFSDLFESFSGPLGLGTAIGALALGLISLFYGRRLYWFFVAVVGFLLGLAIAPELLSDLSTQWQVIASIGLAVLFAILSVALNQFMITLSGGIGLAVVGYTLVQNLFPQWAAIAAAVLSAIIGIILAWFIFDWGLMILSSLAGASLITNSLRYLLPGSASFDIWIFAVLAILGFAYQIVDWTRQNNDDNIENESVTREKVITEKKTDQETQEPGP